MIDIHCHIIPGIDDGAKSMEESIKMLTIAHQDGIRGIIATPHFYYGRYEVPRSEVEKRIEELKNICKEKNLNIDIYPGQEVYLSENIIELYEQGLIGTLHDTKYMLIELDPQRLHKNTFELLYELKLKGVVPIIAHPERYSYVIEDTRVINKFIEEGCLFQITSSSINGIFGNKIKNTAMKLIKHNLCNFIASDAHTTNLRKPVLKEAFNFVNKKEVRVKPIENIVGLKNMQFSEPIFIKSFLERITGK